ncbi:MAG TPA: hypothetical protein VKB84_03655 [Candidatus Binataceae bacterium]|nr:hypothetical protein [Candidatus Binataceae bacterium]
MNERLQVVAITVVVFLLGLGTGIWTQRMRPMPPPPIALMGEFRAPGRMGFGPPPPPAWMAAFLHGPPPGPEEMRTRIEALEPQIAEFRRSVEVIESGFRKQLNAELTPQQQRKLDNVETTMPPPPPPLPGCAGEAGNLFVPMVIYRPALDRLTELLRLNSQQHEQLKSLLIDRRERLLALVDQTPPPSFKLGRMLEESAAASPLPSPR